MLPLREKKACGIERVVLSASLEVMDLLAMGREFDRIETYWNARIHPVRAPAGVPNKAPVVHSLPEYRAPFSQSLWNLSVGLWPIR